MLEGRAKRGEARNEKREPRAKIQEPRSEKIRGDK
jgi:hypothetical protein